MPITAPHYPKRERKLVPAGTHRARLYKIMNLGTWYNLFKGEKKEYPEKNLNLTFEFPDELEEFPDKDIDGNDIMVKKPLVMSKNITLQMGPKANLRKLVEGMLGVSLTDNEAHAFDIETLLGKSCLLTVSHKPSATDPSVVYANIVTASPLMKSMEEPLPVNKAVVFNIDTAPEEEIEKLPEFLKEKVKGSDEYRKRFGGEETPTLDPEDVPF